jgi:hypothetical protein
VGLFKKEISDDSVIVQTFQTIAQSIDVAAQTGMAEDTGLDVGDLWALYFWTIKPFEANPDALSPDYYKILKYTPGSPFAFSNNTRTFESPSKFIFPVHPDDYEHYVKVSMEIRDLLESKYLNVKNLDDSTFMQECGNQIEKIIKANFESLYTNSIQTVIFVLTLALRSILKDTHRINAPTVTRLRKKGFLYISLMATSWQFKTAGQL